MSGNEAAYTHRAHYGDEISLIDLWLMLSRRKWMIAGVVVLSVVLGVMYASMQPVQYEYRSSVELARIYQGPESRGYDLVGSKAGVIVLLQDVIIPAQRRALFGENAPRVAVLERGDAHNLVLASLSVPENRVKEMHRAIIEHLAKYQKAQLERSLPMHTRHLEAMAGIIAEHMETLMVQLEIMSNQGDNNNETRSLINAQKMSDVRSELLRARLQYINIESTVQAIHEASHGTGNGFLAVRSEFPAGTGKRQIVVISLVLGVMIGVFAAFFSEFLSRARNAAWERLQNHKP